MRGDATPVPDAWAGPIEVWLSWLRAARLSPGTVALRRYQLRMLARELGESPWEVSTERLVAWLGSRSWAAGTAQSVRAGVRSFFAWAVATGRADTDPAAGLPPIRAPRGLPRPADAAAVERALAAGTDADRLIVALGAYAGLRRSEVAAARWDWIGPDHIRVTGKGGRTRLVPMHPAVAEALAAERDRRAAGHYGSGWRYRPDSDGGYVFPGRTGGHVSPDAVTRAARRALGSASVHQLRHYFATRVLSHGANLRVVQTLLGHASPATTAVYTQVTDDQLTAAVAALPSWQEGGGDA